MRQWHRFASQLFLALAQAGRWCAWAIAAAMLAGLASAGQALAKQPTPQVVILNSYHPGEEWSDHELAGIVPALKKAYPDITPAIEYLDAKRFPSRSHLDFMSDYLARKYRGRRVDLVMSLDNSALDMLRTHRQELFPEAPVVFAGINHFDSGLFEDRPKTTGVIEDHDIAGTLELALAIHPGVKRVLAIHDYTVSGEAERREMEAVEGRFQGRLRIDYTPMISVPELKDRLQALPPDAMALILSFVTDASGRILTRAESTRLITEACPVPVYAMNQALLGHGIVGGLLLSGQDHAAQATEMALKILAGEDPSRIPVVTSRSRAMFDYKVMQRFHIPDSVLPPGSLVINRPVSFYAQNRLLVNFALAVMALLVLLSALLTAALLRGKRIEAALRDREANYRTIFEASSDSIIIHDIATGAILDANRKAISSYGLDTLEELQRNDFWLASPYSLAEAKAWMDKAAKEGEQIFEWLSRRRDGHIFWEEVHLKKVVLGGRDCLSAVSRDITARKQDQRALLQSEHRYRELFNSVSDLVFTQDMQGRFLTINAAVQGTLGYHPQEVIGRKASEFMHQGLTEFFKTGYLDPLMNQGYTSGVSAYYHKEGGRRFLEYRSQLVTPPKGEPYITGVARDVSERMLQQRQLKQLEDQLRQAQKMEAVGTLAGGIAHDFNNILGAVLGYGELALDSAETGQDPGEEIRQIIAAADRARKLVRQLLTFSRKLEADPKPVDLNREVESAVAILSRTIPKMIAIETKLAPELWRVNADPTQIEQVILNLATNAVDAMPEGGRFTLATSNLDVAQDNMPQHHQVPAGLYVVLTVSDSGHGMDQSTLEHIFDPFFTTKEIGKGTGLGLATIYGIVKGHRGHIFCSSRPDQGASFEIYLPALEEAPTAKGAQAAGMAQAPGGTETILLVDDEDALRLMSSRTLMAAGYKVAMAGSGEEALAVIKAAQPPPDLVVLDLGMPGMGGLKCLERIMALEVSTKVIIASGYAADAQARLALEAGAVGFVAKPFHRLDLLQTVRKALDA